MVPSAEQAVAWGAEENRVVLQSKGLVSNCKETLGERRQMRRVRILPETSEEKSALDRVIAEIRSEHKFSKAVDLDFLVRKWSDTVRETAGGYKLSFYDFTHDLDMRDLIEQVKASVPGRLAKSIEDEIRALDRQFLEVTRPVEEPLLPMEGATPGFWWFRIPRRILADQEENPWPAVEGEKER